MSGIFILWVGYIYTIYRYSIYLYYRYSIVSILYPDSSAGKESACNAGDTGDASSIPESSSNSLHYSCLGNPIDGEDWRVIVQRVAESDTTE